MRWGLLGLLVCAAAVPRVSMIYPEDGACVPPFITAVMELQGAPDESWPRGEANLRLCGGIRRGDERTPPAQMRLQCGDLFSLGTLAEGDGQGAVNFTFEGPGAWLVTLQLDDGRPEPFWAPTTVRVDVADPRHGDLCADPHMERLPEPVFARAGLLVEPRDHPLLVATAANALQELPPDWGLQIMHGPPSRERLRQALAPQVASGRVLLTQLPVANMSEARYCAMFTSPAFWRDVAAERVLTLQPDAALCPRRPHTPQLSDFDDYDFVGAPWGLHAFPRVCWKVAVGRCVGNGGLSLRSRRAMYRAAATVPWDGLREDQYFVRALQTVGLRAAGMPEAHGFCAETLFSPFPLAVHKPWGATPADPEAGFPDEEDYMTDGELATLAKQCPPLEALLEHYAPARSPSRSV